MSSRKVNKPSEMKDVHDASGATAPQYAEVICYDDDDTEEQQPTTSAAVMQSHHQLKRPTTTEKMVLEAIKQLNENKGSSWHAILKYIKSNYITPNEEQRRKRILWFLKNATSSGQLEMIQRSYRLSSSFKKISKAEEKLKAKNKLKAKKLKETENAQKVNQSHQETLQTVDVKKKPLLPARLSERLESITSSRYSMMPSTIFPTENSMIDQNNNMNSFGGKNIKSGANKTDPKAAHQSLNIGKQSMLETDDYESSDDGEVIDEQQQFNRTAAGSGAELQLQPLKRPTTIKKMVFDAILKLNEKKGSSLKAILKYIKSNYAIENNEQQQKNRIFSVLKDATSSNELEMIKRSYRFSKNYKKMVKDEESLKDKKLKEQEKAQKQLKKSELEQQNQETLHQPTSRRRRSMPAVRLSGLMEPSTSRYSLAMLSSSSSSLATTNTPKRATPKNAENNNNNYVDSADKNIKSGTPTDPSSRKALNIQNPTTTKLKSSRSAVKRRVVDMTENEENEDAVAMMPKAKKNVKQAAGKPSTEFNNNRKNIIF